jgi:GAF domain-containing protein
VARVIEQDESSGAWQQGAGPPDVLDPATLSGTPGEWSNSGEGLSEVRLRSAETAARSAADAAAERAQRVGALAAALVAAQTVEDVTVVLAEHVQQAVNGQTFSLREVVAGRAVARAMRLGGIPMGYQDRFAEVPLDLPSAMAEVVAGGRPVFVSSAEDNRRRYGGGAVEHHDAARIEGLARLPLLVEGELIGILSVGYRAPREFDASERLFLTTVADLAAQALGRAMRTERLARDAQRTQRLADLAAVLARTQTSAQVAQVLAEQVQQATACQKFSLREVDPEQGVARAILMGGTGSDYADRFTDVPLGVPSTIAEVVTARSPVFLASAQEYACRYGSDDVEHFEAARLSAMARLPLLVEDELIAILSVGYRAPREFDAAERLFLTTIADLAAQALGRAMRTEWLARDADRARRLGGLAAALVQAQTVDDVTAVLAEHVQRATSCDAFSLREIDTERKVARVIRVSGTPDHHRQRQPELDLDAPTSLAEVAATKLPVFMSTAEKTRGRYGIEAGDEQYEAARAEAVARLPLLVEGELIAILSVGYWAAREFDAAERLFLTTVGDLAAQALGRAMRTEQIRAESRRHRLLSAALAAINRRLDPADQLRALSASVVPELADFSSVHVLARPVPPGVMPELPVITERVSSQIIPGVQAAPLQAGLAWYEGDPITETVRQGRLLTDRIPTPAVPEWATRTGTGATFRTGLNHVVLSPVLVDGLVVAVAAFGMCHDRAPWDPPDLAIIAQITGYAAIALEHGLSYQHSRQTALVLQQALLSPTPRVPGLELCGRYSPAGHDEVGGDWYDAVEVGPGHLMLAVGDVVGHDITAAAAMGQLRAALRTLATDDPDSTPGALLDRLAAANRSLRMTKFATVVIARLTRTEQSWELAWARAGHPPPLLIAPGGATAQLLDQPTGIALVPGHAAPHPTATVSLQPGSTLLLYTDGLIERRGVNLTDSTTELCERAVEMAGQSVAQLCDRLLEHAPGGDDAVLLAVHITT